MTLSDAAIALHFKKLYGFAVRDFITLNSLNCLTFRDNVNGTSYQYNIIHQYLSIIRTSFFEIVFISFFYFAS